MPPDLYKILFSVYATTQASQLDNKGVPKWLAWIPDVIKWIVMSLLGMLLKILQGFLTLVFQMFNSTDQGMNQLAAAAIRGMTGLSASPADFGSLANRDSRTGIATGLATLFTDAMIQAAPRSDDGSLAPSDKAANKFMEIAAHMAIEGWLQGWIVELCTWDKAERFADLKDTLENVLGIGRLSRRAMAAPMTVLVEDPYLALLNSRYHPTRLSPAQAVRYYLRGGANRTELQALMDLDGYRFDYVDALIADERKLPDPSELEVLLSHGSLQDADVLASLKHMGYDDVSAADKLNALKLGRADTVNRAFVHENLALFKAKKISYNEMVALLDKANLPLLENERLVTLIDTLERTRRTQLTLAEGELLYKKGVWDEPKFDALAQWHDYWVEDRQALEDLLAHEIDDERIRAGKRAIWAQRREDAFQRAEQARAERLRLAQQEVESKGVSTAQYELLVEDGLRTPAEYQAYLIRKQVAVDNAIALTQALINKLVVKSAAAAKKAAAAGQAKAKNLDIAQLEAAVKQGLITKADFTANLVHIGLSSTDAELLTEELQGQMDSAAAKAKAVADLKAKAAVKHVDVSQEERAVRLGIETVQQYAAFLDSHGFEPHDRDVLVAEVQAQLATDQQTADKKKAAAAKLAAKGLSLSQLERLVRAGVKTPADYQAALAAAGIDAADQQALMDYLKLQMDQDQQDLLLHGHAAGLVGQLGPSLSDLGRAVKLGVIPVAAYQDVLNRAGLSTADQQTLVKTLAAQIKTTRGQQSTAQSVAKQVSAAGVSLATLEKDVLRGALSMAQFEGLLAGYGVPQTEITDVAALVQDQIDNQRAVSALVGQATARAAAKGLDLAQDTAAYKQGVMSEAEWLSRVGSLGYDAADVEILFETLAAQQAATAAKSAKKPAAGTATTATGAAAAPAGG